MDLIAFKNQRNNDLIKSYIKKYYGDVSRFRGVRFMKLESKVNDKFRIDIADLFKIDNEEDCVDYSKEIEMFNKFAGKDVIYIHTRYSNYDTKKWEEEHKDLFLDHITDSFDSTYCTHYFKAIIDEDYKKILRGDYKCG